MSRISLQMYTMRDYMQSPEEIESTFQQLATIGYRNIQPILPGFMSTADFRTLLDAYGLQADSFSYTAPDITEQIDTLCRTAEILGTNIVRTGSISREQAMSREGFQRYAEEINTKGRVLHNHSLVYTYHFHAYEYVNFGDCTGMDILLRETDPDYVHFQPDTHWMAAAGVEPSVGLHAYTGRMEYVHMQGYAIIPDNNSSEEVPRRIVPVGEGNLNWPGIITAGDALGVRLYVVEQDYCLGDTFDCIRTSFDNLRKLGVE